LLFNFRKYIQVITETDKDIFKTKRNRAEKNHNTIQNMIDRQ